MKLNKTELSWILYDVANSAFILIVTATIPIYFRALATQSNVADHVISAWFGGATSTAVIILAILSPILGAIADYKGMKIHSVRLPGYVASQEVIFGSQGETLRISNEPVNRECYMPGVMLGCRKMMDKVGLTYGLDKLL